jgi:hypothetical protein
MGILTPQMLLPAPSRLRILPSITPSCLIAPHACPTPHFPCASQISTILARHQQNGELSSVRTIAEISTSFGKSCVAIRQ